MSARTPAVIALVALTVLLLVACGSGSSPTQPTAVSVSPVESTVLPTVTPVATQSPTPAPETVLASCLDEAGDKGDISAEIVGCLSGAGLDSAARRAEGPSDIHLVSVGSCTSSNQLIVWRDGSKWKSQDLTPQLPKGYGNKLVTEFRQHSLDTVTSTSAREAPDGSALALTNLFLECTSGSRASMMLLAREGGSWRITWNGANKRDIFEIAHSSAEFSGDGIDRITMVGSSWQLVGDAKRQVLHESNAGSHRYFERTFMLRNGEYVLTDERVFPSAYNTLVEFLYALKVDDDAGAESLTAGDALVDAAKELGLVQPESSRGWLGWCEATIDGRTSYVDPPCTVELPDGGRVSLSMVAAGDAWLISSVELDTPAS